MFSKHFVVIVHIMRITQLLGLRCTAIRVFLSVLLQKEKLKSYYSFLCNGLETSYAHNHKYDSCDKTSKAYSASHTADSS